MKKWTGLLALFCALSTFAGCSFPSGGGSVEEPKDETVQVKYYATASDLTRALQAGEETIGLFSEPFVSDFLELSSTFSVQTDLQELFGEYPQSVVVAKKSVIESDGAFVQSIADGIRQGASWLKNNGHDGVEQVNHNLFEVQTPMLNPNITREEVDRCRVVYQSATNAKQGILEYMQKLNSLQENFVRLPDDEFFYDGTSTSENQEASYTVVTVDGVPALSLAQLMYYDRLADGVGREVEYKVVAPETISAYLVNGDESKLGDVVVLSAVEAVELVGSGEVYQMIGVATKGYDYIVSTQTVASANDLKGKRIGVVGEGETRDLILQSVFKQNQMVYKKV